MNEHDIYKNLPKHTAKEGLWRGIEINLATGQGVLSRLPNHKVSEGLWFEIVRKIELNEQKRFSQKFMPFVRWTAGIAAAVLIMVLVGKNQLAPVQNSFVMHTEEVVTSPISVRVLKSTETHSADFALSCTQYPDVCTTPEFDQLNKTRVKLKGELKRLKDMAEIENDERLGLYITRIEKDIKQLENRMMRLFM